MYKTKIGRKVSAAVLAQILIAALTLRDPSLAVTSLAADNDTIDKEEVVYVITDGDGEVDHIVVSDKLKNEEKKAKIEDASDLTDIENVKGDETFTKNGKDGLTWDAEGKEISYQGKSTKELPVDVIMTYQLDGKKISAKELAGKSGKVTIRFDYKNKQKRKVTIKGKEYSVYVPFTMLSGMILDADKFSNVKVENGKAISEGDRIMVFGYAVPGLKDSLGIDKDYLKDEVDIDLPEYVEVTADVKDFSLDMSITAITNDLMDDLSGNNADTDSLKKDMDDLEDATNQLEDGTSKLSDGVRSAYDGSRQISDHMGKLSKGSDTLADGLKKYTAGVDQLAAKAPALITGVSTLNDAASQIATGADSLNQGTKTYVGGVDQLSGGLLGDGTEKNPGYLNGVEQLKAGAAKLSGLSELGQVSGAISQMRSATSTDPTYTDAQGKKNTTLGSGAKALDENLGNAVAQVEALNKGASAESLRQLAGGLKTANATASAVKAKTDSAAKTVEKNKETVKNAADEVKVQAENVDREKKTLASEKEALKKEISEKNDMITKKNQEIEKAQKSANAEIEDSVDKTIKELKEAKKALESARTDTVKFEDQIKSIEKQINELEAKKADSKVKVTEHAVSGIEASQSQADPSRISDEKLKTYAEDLENNAPAMDFSKEQAVLGMTQQALEAAAAGAGNDPMGDLLNGLKQLKQGSGQLQAGVEGVHQNLALLESRTASFPEAAAGISALNQGFETLTKNDAALKAGAQELLKNSSAITGGTGNLASAAAQLAKGTDTLAKSSSMLSQGAGKLASSNETLNQGGRTLADGARKLTDGSEKLTDGMDQLLDGAEQLKDGMKKYKDDGIRKILDLYHNDIKGLSDRFDAVKEAGKEYQSYTKLADGNKGSVKFIYKSDQIKADEDK